MLVALGGFSLQYWVAFTQIVMLCFHWLATVAWAHLGFEQRQPEGEAARVLADSICTFCFHLCQHNLKNIKR
jgi:hypothetical protein